MTVLYIWDTRVTWDTRSLDLGHSSLIQDSTAEKQVACEERPAAKAISTKGRHRVKHALANGKTAKLSASDRTVALIIAAALARVDGDVKALAHWPEVDAIVSEALTAKKAGRPKTSAND